MAFIPMTKLVSGQGYFYKKIFPYVLRRIVEGFWNFVLEKFLNVQNLMDSSVRARNKRVLRELQAINA